MLLILTFSKITEKLVLILLFEHLSLNQFLTQHQHGFLAAKSTITALISLVEFLLDQQKEQNRSPAMFLDCSKAFDLYHNHRNTKINYFRIKRKYNSMVCQIYLANRSQMVEITHLVNRKTETVSSKLKLILWGIPQGSIEGPTHLLREHPWNPFVSYCSQWLS